MGRLAHAWNAFMNPEVKQSPFNVELRSSTPMDRSPLRYIPQSNIIAPFSTKLRLTWLRSVFDMSDVQSIRHISKTFRQVLMTVLRSRRTWIRLLGHSCRTYALRSSKKGVAAIVPTDYSKAPVGTNSYDVYNLRVGRITQFKTSSLIVDVYNEKTGRREPVELPKRLVAVVQNPLASITSSRGSLASRLSSKLRILDSIDNAAAGKKLDLIVQLPYTVRTERRKEEAEDG